MIEPEPWNFEAVSVSEIFESSSWPCMFCRTRIASSSLCTALALSSEAPTESGPSSRALIDAAGTVRAASPV